MNKLKSIFKRYSFKRICFLLYSRLYFRYFALRYKRYSIVYLVDPGFGDCCIAMSYLEHFKAKVNNSVLLVAGKRLEPLIKCYKGYDRIKLVSDKHIAILHCAFPYRFIHKYVWHWKEKMNDRDRLVLTPLAAINLYKTTLDALVLTRDRIYRVDVNSVYQKPVVDTNLYRPIASIIGDNNILFNPFSNSSRADINSFIPIIEYFRSLGYNLYTNCKDENSLCLPCTERLVANIFDLYLTADKFAFIVSTRSGILDFLVTKNSRMIVLFEHNGYENTYNMDMWKCGKILQMFYDDPQMMEKVDEYVKEIGEINES